jgi:hypothetical protein
MAGKALVNFADFVETTDAHYLTDADEILSDAVKKTYGCPMLNTGLKGRTKEEVIRGGDSIKEIVQFDKGTQAGFYLPGATHSPTNEDVNSTLTFNWRYLKNHWGWVDQEIKLNEGEPEKVQYKRIKKSKEQAAYVDMYGLMEDTFISAAPVSTDMESNDGTKPYCLRAIITEDGGPPDTADGASVAWTNVFGVNPDTKIKHKNKVANYTASSKDTTLMKAFRQMWRKLQYKKPRTRDDYFKDENFQKTRILTSDDGQEEYENVLFGGNDSFKPSNDAGRNTEDPLFRGIPVEYVEAMDDIGYTTGSPRYFWLNQNYVFPVFHAGRYMERMAPVNLGPVGQPESWVVYVLSWYQIVCRSRGRQGIICPA